MIPDKEDEMMCHGKITSRKSKERCSICGFGPVEFVMVNQTVDFVPLVRLDKFKTKINRAFRLCGKCVIEDAEVALQDRLKK
jgi:hypothetical protein